MRPGASRDEYLGLLRDVHEAFLGGRRPPARPRPVIHESWQRVRRAGVEPTVGGLPGEHTDHGGQGDVRSAVPSPLTSLLPLLRAQVEPLLDDDETLLVLADERGEVVGRAGGRVMSRRADELGFRIGYPWSERAVGTNGIGTALATGAPVHIHGAEHFCYAQHEWSCAGAPIHDPRTGRVLGVVDLSMRATEAHPSVVALAASLAAQAEFALRDAHRRSLVKLRSALSSP
ncbi:GAF domain-containing protein, partial [Microbacterium sp.]|uniref:GAF domain-containing protein n=1 Tax=Microbacterium sp. TaxID=51671 RepID=UPI003C786C6F